MVQRFRLLQRSATSDTEAMPRALARAKADSPQLFSPPSQTGRCCLAVTELPAITINSLLFVPNEPCFRCGLLIDWSCSPGSHSDGRFCFFFTRRFTQSSGRKRKKNLTYSAALQGWWCCVGIHFFQKKPKNPWFLSEIRIQMSEKEEWHLFHLFYFFHLPPVAFLTLEGRPVNKPLRAVNIQSDILAGGADSSFSLLGVKRKKNK